MSGSIEIIRHESRWSPALTILAVILLMAALRGHVFVIPVWVSHLAALVALTSMAAVAITNWGAGPAAAQAKPNIVVIMGDDIGIWNIGAYHRGMMAGRTPNLDKIAAEGMLFTDYYAEASCTAGRANFITGELPIRTGMTTVGQALVRRPVSRRRPRPSPRC